MEYIKIYLPDDKAGKFREAAMQEYGYKKGSLSKAAEEALEEWMKRRRQQEKKRILKEFPECREAIRDPVGTSKGLLKGVKKSSVELQHDAMDIWAENAMKYRKK